MLLQLKQTYTICRIKKKKDEYYLDFIGKILSKNVEGTRLRVILGPVLKIESDTSPLRWMVIEQIRKIPFNFTNCNINHGNPHTLVDELISSDGDHIMFSNDPEDEKLFQKLEEKC